MSLYIKRFLFTLKLFFPGKKIQTRKKSEKREDTLDSTVKHFEIADRSLARFHDERVDYFGW